LDIDYGQLVAALSSANHTAVSISIISLLRLSFGSTSELDVSNQGHSFLFAD